jgi:hypothetical protein
VFKVFTGKFPRYFLKQRFLTLTSLKYGYANCTM